MKQNNKCWAVIPAAGVGKRMESDIPKQYLSLNGWSVIDLTIQVFMDNPRIAGVFVALSANDGWWMRTRSAKLPTVVRVQGGEERCYSVLNCLSRMKESLSDQDWVLVHDAARPCLTQDDLNMLLDRLMEHPVGGLLAVPVTDTVKQLNSNLEVKKTLSRDQLWRAFTPQMFRLGQLFDALGAALSKKLWVTDDASAIELMGMQPLVIEGKSSNIKITRPEDLKLAEFFLQNRSVG